MYRSPEGRILVRPVDEKKTAGGLYLPESADRNAMKGEVVSVGEPMKAVGGRTVPFPFAEGDVVLYGRLSGLAVEMDGEEYRTLKHDEILGFLTS